LSLGFGPMGSGLKKLKCTGCTSCRGKTKKHGQGSPYYVRKAPVVIERQVVIIINYDSVLTEF